MQAPAALHDAGVKLHAIFRRVHLPAGVPEGLIGVAIFSLTMPLMKVAVYELDPVLVGAGRFLVALLPAALTLLSLKAPLPNRRQLLSLLVIAGCFVFGFSWLFAAALKQVPSYHAAIVAGALPLVVAITAAIRERERLSRSFWLAAVAGALTVVGYGLAKSGWTPNPADLLLITGAIAGGIGYVEGGRLGKEMGALVVSCWVPVVAAPFALIVCAANLPESLGKVSIPAWLAFGYNGIFSCWFGFIFWYRGLGRGGVARIGQLQLLQPFFTLVFIALFLRESMVMGDWITAVAVVFCVAAAQMSTRPLAANRQKERPKIRRRRSVGGKCRVP